MVTAYRWDRTHRCIITVQLRCHARTDRLCSNPHFMNSFPNYRSGGAPNVLFLEYRSKIQNDWKLLKCMSLSTVTLRAARIVMLAIRLTRVRTVASLKGLLILVALPRAQPPQQAQQRRLSGSRSRPGLTAIPPLRGWTLSNRSTLPTQNKSSYTLSTRGSAACFLPAMWCRGFERLARHVLSSFSQRCWEAARW
jgi:hypothetical protein